MRAVVKNWSQMQHYKDRAPPWIKLHKRLLDDFEFACLPLASKALAPWIWLLASEENDGSVRIDLEFLQFRFRWPKSELEEGLKGLIDKGFLIVASGLLAERKQEARLETEEEGEKETEEEGEKEKEFAPDQPKADQAPPVISLQLANKTEYPITQTTIDELAELYPAVDVLQELRNMRGWLMGSPDRRKTRSGIMRFVNTWLAKSQNQWPKRPTNGTPAAAATFTGKKYEGTPDDELPAHLRPVH